MKEVSLNGLDFIRRQEGLMLFAYRDSAGILSIGFGHALKKSELTSGKILLHEEEIKWDKGLTGKQARDLLDVDLDVVENFLTQDQASKDLEDHEYDALCSLVFNIGTGAYLGSTLRKLLLVGHKQEAGEQFPRWKYCAGRILPGLVRRREAERKLWSNADYSG